MDTATRAIREGKALDALQRDVAQRFGAHVLVEADPTRRRDDDTLRLRVCCTRRTSDMTMREIHGSIFLLLTRRGLRFHIEFVGEMTA